jgi:hypothetical protein
MQQLCQCVLLRFCEFVALLSVRRASAARAAVRAQLAASAAACREAYFCGSGAGCCWQMRDVAGGGHAVAGLAGPAAQHTHIYSLMIVSVLCCLH